MALYNYLFAKKHGGKWIMRVEDTDTVSIDFSSFYHPYSLRTDADGARLSGRYKKGVGMGGITIRLWYVLCLGFGLHLIISGPHKDGPHSPYFQVSNLQRLPTRN